MEGTRAAKELSHRQELDARKEAVTTHGGHWGKGILSKDSLRRNPCYFQLFSSARRHPPPSGSPEQQQIKLNPTHYNYPHSKQNLAVAQQTTCKSILLRGRWMHCSSPLLLLG